jgi:hypothetical protein
MKALRDKYFDKFPESSPTDVQKIYFAIFEYGVVHSYDWSTVDEWDDDTFVSMQTEIEIIKRFIRSNSYKPDILMNRYSFLIFGNEDSMLSPFELEGDYFNGQ